MQFTCSAKELSFNLSIVNRVIQKRNTHPILSQVLVVAEDETITLTGFDLSLGTKLSFPAVVIGKGTFTVPSQLLLDIISRLDDGTITVENILCAESVEVHITTNSSYYNLSGTNASEYPSLFNPEDSQSIDIPASILREGLRTCLPSASKDETKRILTGVNISDNGQNLTLASTDGHRLTVFTSNITTGREFGLTIPARGLEEVAKILGDEDVTIEYNNELITFKVGNITIASRILSDTYPAYLQLIPPTFQHQLSVGKKALISGLSRMAIFADKGNLVQWQINKQTLVLESESKDLGKASETLPLDSLKLSEITICFNLKYLLEGIKIIPQEQIDLKYNDSNRPIVIETSNDDYKLVYLIMPVQLRE
jgi:DNA polymerase-3 subunit beta